MLHDSTTGKVSFSPVNDSVQAQKDNGFNYSLKKIASKISRIGKVRKVRKGRKGRRGKGKRGNR